MADDPAPSNSMAPCDPGLLLNELTSQLLIEGADTELRVCLGVVDEQRHHLVLTLERIDISLTVCFGHVRSCQGSSVVLAAVFIFHVPNSSSSPPLATPR